MRNLFIFIIFVTLGAYAQELPPIQNFSPLDYDGENQNWAISQGSDNHIYIANNHSLLEYNGVNWRKYASPNNSIIRSVQGAGDQIFTGQYMEFGYWQKNIFGELEYTSVSDELEIPMVEDEEFWNIIRLGDWVLFQSLDRIYSYNVITKDFKSIEVKATKAQMFRVNESVYFQNQDKHVFRIENGEPVVAIDAQVLGSKNVVGMYSELNTLVVILDDATFLEISNTEVKPRDIRLLKSKGMLSFTLPIS